jgi:hypothetical protein
MGPLWCVDLRDPGGASACLPGVRRRVHDDDVGVLAGPKAVDPDQRGGGSYLALEDVGDAIVVDVGVLARRAATAAPAHSDPGAGEGPLSPLRHSRGVHVAFTVH